RDGSGGSHGRVRAVDEALGHRVQVGALHAEELLAQRGDEGRAVLIADVATLPPRGEVDLEVGLRGQAELFAQCGSGTDAHASSSMCSRPRGRALSTSTSTFGSILRSARVLIASFRSRMRYLI